MTAIRPNSAAARLEALARVEFRKRACQLAGPNDWCKCRPNFVEDTLLNFAPPGVEVEREPPPPEAYELFCSKCSKPVNPIYLSGFGPDLSINWYPEDE
jgi:hypothetical protein